MVASSAFVIVNSLRLGDATQADSENHFLAAPAEELSSAAAMPAANAFPVPIAEAMAR
jgi:hypothetical protein